MMVWEGRVGGWVGGLGGRGERGGLNELVLWVLFAWMGGWVGGLEEEEEEVGGWVGYLPWPPRR